MNHLETAVGQWFEFCGYLVFRNVPVDKGKRGGYETELDVVALSAKRRHLVHVEASMDGDAWTKRELRFARKFAAGRKHIPLLPQFEGLPLPETIDQVALLCFASPTKREQVGGGRILHIHDFYREVWKGVEDRCSKRHAVSEQFGYVRTIHQVQEALASKQQNPQNPKKLIP